MIRSEIRIEKVSEFPHWNEFHILLDGEFVSWITSEKEASDYEIEKIAVRELLEQISVKRIDLKDLQEQAKKDPTIHYDIERTHDRYWYVGMGGKQLYLLLTIETNEADKAVLLARIDFAIKLIGKSEITINHTSEK